MAIIFAWTGCLKKRGELDKTPDVVEFAKKLEEAAIETIESGILTGDLMKVVIPNQKNRQVYTEEFIDAITNKFEEKILKIGG